MAPRLPSPTTVSSLDRAKDNKCEEKQNFATKDRWSTTDRSKHDLATRNNQRGLRPPYEGVASFHAEEQAGSFQSIPNLNVVPYGGSAGTGLYGMGSLYSSPMMGGPYSWPSTVSPMGGPFSGLNQFLFGVQNVIFSLTQAVQIVGMNTHALSQLFEAATGMVDHAISTFHEMQTLEVTARAHESEEAKKRRRRLRALRWALVAAGTYAFYKIVRAVITMRMRTRLRKHIEATSSYHHTTDRPPNRAELYWNERYARNPSTVYSTQEAWLAPQHEIYSPYHSQPDLPNQNNWQW